MRRESPTCTPVHICTPSSPWLKTGILRCRVQQDPRDPQEPHPQVAAVVANFHWPPVFPDPGHGARTIPASHRPNSTRPRQTSVATHPRLPIRLRRRWSSGTSASPKKKPFARRAPTHCPILFFGHMHTHAPSSPHACLCKKNPNRIRFDVRLMQRVPVSLHSASAAQPGARTVLTLVVCSCCAVRRVCSSHTRIRPVVYAQSANRMIRPSSLFSASRGCRLRSNGLCSRHHRFARFESHQCTV